MFTAVFQDGGTMLKKIVNIVKEELEDAVLIAKPTGLYLQSMDRSHVALVDLHLFPDAASSYVCNDVHYLGINFITWSKIFSSKSIKGICVLSYKETKPDVLQCTFQGNKRKSSFQMKLRSIDESEQQEMVPNDIQYASEVVLDSVDLEKILHDISIVSEDVVLTRTDKKLYFNGAGDTANCNTEMDVNQLFDGSLVGTYSLKYLMWFSKACTLCSETTLAFDDDHPLLLHFQNDSISLKFFVAGKVNENQENQSNRENTNEGGEDDEDDE